MQVHEEAPDAAVAVGERMNRFELEMHPSTERKNIFSEHVALSVRGLPLQHHRHDILHPRGGVLHAGNTNVAPPKLAGIRLDPMEHFVVEFQRGSQSEESLSPLDELRKGRRMLNRLDDVQHRAVRDGPLFEEDSFDVRAAEGISLDCVRPPGVECARALPRVSRQGIQGRAGQERIPEGHQYVLSHLYVYIPYYIFNPIWYTRI